MKRLPHFSKSNYPIIIISFVFFFITHLCWAGDFFHDYKVNEKGKIVLVKKTTDDFDRLIAVKNNREKIRLKDDGTPKQDHIIISKGILENREAVEASQDGRQFKGQRINFHDDQATAQLVFEFLADNTYVEWSLLSYSSEQETRSQLYTSYRRDLEFFGAQRSFRIANADNLTLLKHWHSHPRFPAEEVGKYDFPSVPDLNFRDHLLKKRIPSTEFKIRTGGMYIDYSSPQEWNKSSSHYKTLMLG